MQTFIADIIPQLQKFSKKLDDLTLLTNQHWVVLDELENAKNVYIFRSNNELLISSNGKVEKGKWEYLGNNSLLIDRKDDSYLFKHGFFDENVMALKIDGKEEYAFLVNENRFDGELNSKEKVLQFLSNRYLNLIPSEKTKVQPETVAEFRKTKEQIESEEKRLNNFAIGFVVIMMVIFLIINLFLHENK